MFLVWGVMVCFCTSCKYMKQVGTQAHAEDIYYLQATLVILYLYTHIHILYTLSFMSFCACQQKVYKWG